MQAGGRKSPPGSKTFIPRPLHRAGTAGNLALFRGGRGRGRGRGGGAYRPRVASVGAPTTGSQQPATLQRASSGYVIFPPPPPAATLPPPPVTTTTTAPVREPSPPPPAATALPPPPTISLPLPSPGTSVSDGLMSPLHSDRVPCHQPLPVGLEALIGVKDPAQSDVNKDKVCFYDQGRFNFSRLTNAPFVILTTRCVRKLAAGREHALILCDDGIIRSWGSSDHGQLGHGDKEVRSRPTPISNVTKVIRIAACGDKSGAVTDDGELLLWGHSSFNLDTGDVKPEAQLWPLPRRSVLGAKRNEKVADVAIGLSHWVLCLQSGDVFTFGQNASGCLGVANIRPSEYQRIVQDSTLVTQHCVSVAAGPYSCAAITKKGRCLGTGTETWRPRKLDLPDAVDHVCMGRQHLMAVLQSGHVIGLGANDHHQLGIVDTLAQKQPCLIRFPGMESDAPTWLDGKRRKKRRGAKAVPPSVVITHVTCYNQLSVAMSDQGSVYVWGRCEGMDPYIARDKQALKTPELIQELQHVHLIGALAAPCAIMLVMDISNLPNIRFSTFDPPTVECGTPEALARWVLNAKRRKSFVTGFILMHSTFMTLAQLLHTFGNVVHDPTTGAKQLATLVVFLQQYIKDRHDAGNLQTQADVDALEHWLDQTLVACTSDATVAKLKRLLYEPAPPMQPIPTAAANTSLDQELKTMLPAQFAEQLALAQLFWLQRISSQELLSREWSKKGSSGAPNVRRSVAFFDDVWVWGKTYIVTGATRSEREQRATYLADVLSESLRLRDYATVRALSAVLTSVHVTKLKRGQCLSWKRRIDDLLADLKLLWKSNSRKYRDLVDQAVKGAQSTIPYLGLHLGDLVYMNDGMSDSTSADATFVNWEKRRRISGVVCMLKNAIQRGYPGLTPREPVFALLFTSPGLDEEQLSAVVASLVGEGNYDTSDATEDQVPVARSPRFARLRRRASTGGGKVSGQASPRNQTLSPRVASQGSVRTPRSLCTQGPAVKVIPALVMACQCETEHALGLFLRDLLHALRSTAASVTLPSGACITLRVAFCRSTALEELMVTMMTLCNKSRTSGHGNGALCDATQANMRTVLQHSIATQHQGHIDAIVACVCSWSLSEDVGQVRQVAQMLACFRALEDTVCSVDEDASESSGSSASSASLGPQSGTAPAFVSSPELSQFCDTLTAALGSTKSQTDAKVVQSRVSAASKACHTVLTSYNVDHVKQLVQQAAAGPVAAVARELQMLDDEEDRLRQRLAEIERQRQVVIERHAMQIGRKPADVRSGVQQHAVVGVVSKLFERAFEERQRELARLCESGPSVANPGGGSNDDAVAQAVRSLFGSAAKRAEHLRQLYLGSADQAATKAAVTDLTQVWHGLPECIRNYRATDSITDGLIDVDRQFVNSVLSVIQ